MVDDAYPPYKPGEQPTLHQILVAEKLDFEAKVQRAAKRKKWLKGEFIISPFIISFQSLFETLKFSTFFGNFQPTRRY